MAVVTPDGRGMADAVVVAERDGETHAWPADEHGVAVFEDLVPGEWHLTVDPASLPSWAHAPWRQELRPPTRVVLPAGFHGVRATVTAGEDASAQITVLIPAVIRGRVTDARGRGVPGVYPAVRTRLIGMYYSESAETDQDGYYEIQDVAPGDFFYMHVRVPPDDSRGFLARPPPRDVVIAAGSTNQIDFVLGGGTNTVTGSLVDGEGQALPNFPVLIYYWKEPWEQRPGEKVYGIGGGGNMLTTTDENGRYVFSGLYDGRMKINYTPAADQKGIYAGWHRSIDVGVLGGGATVEIPPMTVWLSHPFSLEGTIELSDEAARMKDVDVVLRKLPGYVLPAEYDNVIFPPFVYGNPEAMERRLEVDRDDGTFRWECETPHAAVEVIVSSGDLTRRFTVEPVPDTTRSLEVRL